jgi:hypothetical protein
MDDLKWLPFKVGSKQKKDGDYEWFSYLNTYPSTVMAPLIGKEIEKYFDQGHQ